MKDFSGNRFCLSNDKSQKFLLCTLQSNLSYHHGKAEFMNWSDMSQRTVAKPKSSRNSIAASRSDT